MREHNEKIEFEKQLNSNKDLSQFTENKKPIVHHDSYLSSTDNNIQDNDSTRQQLNNEQKDCRVAEDNFDLQIQDSPSYTTISDAEKNKIVKKDLNSLVRNSITVVDDATVKSISPFLINVDVNCANNNTVDKCPLKSSLTQPSPRSRLSKEFNFGKNYLEFSKNKGYYINEVRTFF